MAIELVDGHAGEPHIDGSDAGIFKAGVCGKEGGILDTANRCACTINSNTSVTVAEGELIMPTSGRLVRVKHPETLTVTTGSTGQRRNDLIVARYDKDSTTEIETVSLIVLRGTPTTGTPVDPATQVGDLKLYRLQLNGLTLQTPVKLATDIMPITNKLIATGTVNIGGKPFVVSAYYHSASRTVEIMCRSDAIITYSAGIYYSSTAFTMPVEYRYQGFCEQACRSYANWGFTQGFSCSKEGNVGLFWSASKTVESMVTGQFSMSYSI